MSTVSPAPQSTTENILKSARFIDADKFREYIELEVLKIIKGLAQKGEIPKERIQEIAKYSLSLIKPGMALDELYQSAVRLDDNHSELGPVVIMLMTEYEKNYEHKALDHVSDLIKSGKYDEAQDMVKKVLLFKIQ